ncbi:MAG: hypothetical protein QXK65_03110, partial [Candidatus Micrarchaeaceae archaeon]
RYGKKKIALLGNLFIPILSFTGFSYSAVEATALFSGGWWARNFRTPARRAMIGDITPKQFKGRVFGFLNALDIGGGIVSITYLSIAISLGVKISSVFIYTALPILLSSLCLAFVKYNGVNKVKKAVVAARRKIEAAKETAARSSYRAVIIATGLYGLSFYSMSFPVLTIAQKSGNLAGVASYAVFLLVSAVFGYIIGARVRKVVHGLAFLGYLLAAFGSLVLGLSYAFNFGVIVSYLGMLLIGMAAGTIETLEPTIISTISSKRGSGSRMGALTASRSLGLFFANLLMGFLYIIGPIYSYSFAAALAASAAAVLLAFGNEIKL